MNTTPKNNSPAHGISSGGAAEIIFALAALLGALSGIFAEVPVFSAVTVFAVSAIIFLFAREIVPICGILIPCFFEYSMTGSLLLPAIYIGFAFSMGASAYLVIAKKGFLPFAAAAAGYAAGALVRDPVTAIAVLIPIAIGMLAGLLLPRFRFTEALSMLTILIFSAAVIAFLALGGDITGTAEMIRAYIIELYRGLNEQMFIIEESTIEMIAAYMVNILPGVIFAAISAFCYIACSLTASLLRSTGAGEEVTENMQSFSLSPVSGIIFILCFLLSAAFAEEGGDLEIASAAADNIMVALILPLALSGCISARNRLMNRTFASSFRRRQLSVAAIVIFFAIASSTAFIVFTCIGIIGSLKPIFSALTKKLRSYGQDK